MKIINKLTGKENTAIYARNSRGNMQYNVDGKFMSDKSFDRLYFIPSDNIKSISINNLVTTLKSKKVLFIENDNGLYHGLDQIEEVFIANNIEYKCLFDVSEKPFEEIIKAITEHDAIVFQTQWVYAISKKISEYMFKSKEKKIVIECVIGDPTWYYKPKSVHDVYLCKPPHRAWKDDVVDPAKWKFYKLSQKPYWDYKNGFDK